jgi:hypothetical protein
VDDAEKLFGAFSKPRDRESFQRKVFKDMKEGEVMRGERLPLTTEKGSLIYRLAHIKKDRIPDQFTADVEDEIVKKLRREALDKRAMEETHLAVGRINALGLARAEAEFQRTLLRSEPVRAGQPLHDPSGDHGDVPDGGRILEKAFEMRKQSQVGKAAFLDAGPGRPKYVVALVRALEAKMDEFEAQKPWLREKLLGNNFEAGRPVPGKRQQLIDTKRAELEKGIVQKTSEEAAASPGTAKPGATPPRPAVPPPVRLQPPASARPPVAVPASAAPQTPPPAAPAPSSAVPKAPQAPPPAAPPPAEAPKQ